jgi:hypothetical protein
MTWTTLGLPTLKYRRLRGDLIEAYKIITSYNEDINCMLSFNKDTITRGDRFKLFQGQVRYDLRKYFFSNRILSIWNSLPDQVVSSDSLNMFKNRFDRFMRNQDIIYDWEAEYDGTGSRSRIQESFLL